MRMAYRRSDCLQQREVHPSPRHAILTGKSNANSTTRLLQHPFPINLMQPHPSTVRRMLAGHWPYKRMAISTVKVRKPKSVLQITILETKRGAA